MQLYEKYRPQTWADVVGQPGAIKQIDTIRQKSGIGGQVWFISGSSGTGKTTIAKLLAQEIADPLNVETLVGRELTFNMVKELARSLHTYGLGAKPGRAMIVNEIHGICKPAVEALLEYLEPVPDHATWIFTTTSEGEEKLFDDYDDCPAFLSRAKIVRLARRDLTKAFAARLVAVAEAEGFAGWTIDKAVRVLQNCRNNLRAAFQALESSPLAEVAA